MSTLKTTNIAHPSATGTNIVLNSDDSATFSQIAGGAITSGTSVASTSGTSIDFTSIPSWVKRITVMFDGVSTNGGSNWLVRLGTSSGVASSGYLGSGSYNGSANGGGNSTTGFIHLIGGGSQIMHGSMIISLINPSTNKWTQQSILGDSSQAFTFISGGTVSLSGTLDRVRITTVNGTDTFDAGTINILYEG